MGHYEWDVCSNCGSRISETRMGIASDTTMGAGIMQCPHCGVTLRTGKTEWQHKSKLGKADYYARVIWWCIGAAFFGCWGTFLLGVIICRFFTKEVEQFFSFIVPLALLGGVCAVGRTISVVRKEITDSLNRTRGKRWHQ